MLQNLQQNNSINYSKMQITDQDELKPAQHKVMHSKLVLYVLEYDHLRNPPAKKKRQAILWQVMIGFHHFQRQLQFSLQELTQMNTKFPSHPELASRQAVKCNPVNE